MQKQIEKEIPWDGKDYQHPNFMKRYDTLEEKGGYYRDSYNDSNLLWGIGFSYWKTPEELKWKFNKRGDLSKEGVKQFLQYLDDNTENILRSFDSLDMETKTYKLEKLKKLKLFLKTAIEMKSSIRWSV
jgi:hypothetical protein